MKKTYRLKVAGLERELPICPLNEKMSIAAFIMFSDVELTVACAKELLTRVPDPRGFPLPMRWRASRGKITIPPARPKNSI